MNAKACLNGSGSTNFLFTLEFLLCPFHPKKDKVDQMGQSILDQMGQSIQEWAK